VGSESKTHNNRSSVPDECHGLNILTKLFHIHGFCLPTWWSRSEGEKMVLSAPVLCLPGSPGAVLARHAGLPGPPAVLASPPQLAGGPARPSSPPGCLGPARRTDTSAGQLAGHRSIFQKRESLLSIWVGRGWFLFSLLGPGRKKGFH